jgi:hypothetical protein
MVRETEGWHQILSNIWLRFSSLLLQINAAKRVGSATVGRPGVDVADKMIYAWS